MKKQSSDKLWPTVLCARWNSRTHLLSPLEDNSPKVSVRDGIRGGGRGEGEEDSHSATMLFFPTRPVDGALVP